jgi:DNA-directed RNA polymerase
MDSQALTPHIARGETPYSRQVQLEEWQRRVGASRATEEGWQSGATSFMAYRMVEPYLSLVLDYYEKGKVHAGRHALIWDLLGNEENVKQVALEALFQLFGSSEPVHRYNWLSSNIARRAEYVLWLNHPDMRGWHLEGLRLASSNDLGMRNVMQRLRDKGFQKATSYRPLDKLERVALGAFFVEAICASTKMFEISIDYDDSRRKFKTVKPTLLYWDFLKRWKQNLMAFRQAYTLMTVPPKPYTEYADGGYLSIETKWPKIPWEKYPSFIEHADPCVLASINKLQSVPFNIDYGQLDLIRWAWDTGHEIGAIPRMERKVELPFYVLMEKHKSDSSKAWREVWQARADHKKDGARGKTINTFVACERLKPFHTVYSCWSADSRGRLYPRAGQLSYAGADPHRSLLLFDKRVPIKGNESEFAWAMGDAIGLPVAGSERQQWMDSNQDLIRMVGESPWGCLDLWSNRKKPWRFVQLCREWFDYTEDPGHLTGLPFQCDQTTSGYGIVACLTRDARLAEWTNVTGGRPLDLYMMIAAKVKDVALKDYENQSDELVKLYIAWWLDNWPDRSLFKPAIMPVIYGRRHYSMRRELATLLVDRFSHSQSPEGCQAVALANCLSRLILIGVGECLPQLLELARWLSRAGSALIAEGTRPYWYTPNGLRIESYSSMTRKKRMALMLSGRKVSIQIRDGSGEPLKGTVSHLAADYIHSVDAAFLQRFVSQWTHEIVTVHDCFATTLDKIGTMRSQLRDSFREFYQPDYLYQHWLHLRRHEGIELAPPPSVGSLDLDAIGQNPYLFT